MTASAVAEISASLAENRCTTRISGDSQEMPAAGCEFNHSSLQ
jgi:hypothetical protein